MSYRYLEIAADLRRRITSGEFPPGSRLPGVGALSRAYGAGKPIIQEAITVLELEGRVVVRERQGTFVSDMPEQRQRLDVGRAVRRNELGYVFAKPAGHWHPIGTPTRDWVACPGDVAGLLGVEPGAEVLARRRVVGPGRPMQVTTTYLPADLARGTVLSEADTGPGGYLDRLEQDMGYGPLAWQVEVYCRLPTQQEAGDLGMSPRLPVMVTIRAHTAPSDRTVAVDQVVVDARWFSIRVPIVRGPSARWPVTPATARNTPPASDTPSGATSAPPHDGVTR